MRERESEGVSEATELHEVGLLRARGIASA
jgi:hypothetical protein